MTSPQIATYYAGTIFIEGVGLNPDTASLVLGVSVALVLEQKPFAHHVGHRSESRCCRSRLRYRRMLLLRRQPGTSTHHDVGRILTVHWNDSTVGYHVLFKPETVKADPFFVATAPPALPPPMKMESSPNQLRMLLLLECSSSWQRSADSG